MFFQSIQKNEKMKFVAKQLLVAILTSSSWHQVASVVGGEDAAATRYPYFARLSVQVEEGVLFCGATLIHKGE